MNSKERITMMSWIQAIVCSPSRKILCRSNVWWCKAPDGWPPTESTYSKHIPNAVRCKRNACKTRWVICALSLVVLRTYGSMRLEILLSIWKPRRRLTDGGTTSDAWAEGWAGTMVSGRAATVCGEVTVTDTVLVSTAVLVWMAVDVIVSVIGGKVMDKVSVAVTLVVTNSVIEDVIVVDNVDVSVTVETTVSTGNVETWAMVDVSVIVTAGKVIETVDTIGGSCKTVVDWMTSVDVTVIGGWVTGRRSVTVVVDTDIDVSVAKTNCVEVTDSVTVVGAIETSVTVTGVGVTTTVSVAIDVWISTTVDVTISVDIIVLAGRVMCCVSVAISVVVNLLVSVEYSVKVIGETGSDKYSVVVDVSTAVVVNVSVNVVVRTAGLVKTSSLRVAFWVGTRLLRCSPLKLLSKLKKLEKMFCASAVWCTVKALAKTNKNKSFIFAFVVGVCLFLDPTCLRSTNKLKWFYDWRSCHICKEPRASSVCAVYTSTHHSSAFGQMGGTGGIAQKKLPAASTTLHGRVLYIHILPSCVIEAEEPDAVFSSGSWLLHLSWRLNIALMVVLLRSDIA